IQWRQGFAGLLNKVGLVANVFGGAAQALDNLGTVPAQGVQHSGLPFDSACSPTPVTGCIGSYSTGAPANYNLKGVCSWDSIHTTVAPYNNCTSALKYLGSNPSSDGVTWDAGSTNFCDAADHFIAAGIASGKDASCRLMTLLGPGGDVIFAIRSDSPNRLASGVAEFTRFCDLLNAPTNGGQCSRTSSSGGTLRLVYHPLTVTDAFTFVFSGFSTDSITTNAPNLGWHLYTGANSWGPAFNQQWALYDGSFVSSICGGSSLSTGSLLQDYVYSCNTKMDHYTEMVEDNVTITGAAQSLQPAMEIFGNHTINNPTVSRTQQFGYAKGWTGVSDATGIGRATGNFWSLDNAWNPSPAISGPTIRWGMKQGTSILNPFLSTSVFEFNILQEVYDSLLTVAPYIPGTGAQIIGYMANTYSLVSHSGAVGTTDANCPASIGVFAVQGCMKISLRGDIFFQDGVQVTASDVKFSFDSLQPPNVIDVTFDPSVLPTSLGGTESPGQPESLYIALKWANAFALFDIGGVPIVPQHIWKTIGAAGACTDTSISNPGSGRGFPQ
ncbi:MAG TPA: hypothetical protein VK667_09125, partial [Ktedonobacteraceae bacterium]|nr:hypothetical protein [Ktedonobacteraceae bacterium]